MLLTLESFETDFAPAEVQSPDYSMGFDEGYAAGIEAAEAKNTALSDTLVQTISDIDFTYAEARAQQLQGLGPLFNAITEQILPHCVATGFAGQLAADLHQVAVADAQRPLSVHLHPDQQAAINVALGDLSNRVTIRPDPAIGLNAAWIKRGNHETLLDMDTILARITEMTCAINNPENRTISHE